MKNEDNVSIQKEKPSNKDIKRARRMVVDYRELNKVTVRKFFLTPNSDYNKSTVAGNTYVSLGDLKASLTNSTEKLIFKMPSIRHTHIMYTR